MNIKNWRDISVNFVSAIYIGALFALFNLFYIYSSYPQIILQIVEKNIKILIASISNGVFFCQ